MTDLIVPIEKKAKKSKSSDKVIELASKEELILKTDGKSDKPFRLLNLTDNYQFD